MTKKQVPDSIAGVKTSENDPPAVNLNGYAPCTISFMLLDGETLVKLDPEQIKSAKRVKPGDALCYDTTGCDGNCRCDGGVSEVGGTLVLMDDGNHIQTMNSFEWVKEFLPYIKMNKHDAISNARTMRDTRPRPAKKAKK